MFGLDHLAQLGAQHRDVLRLFGVGLGGKQADEAIEGDHAAIGAAAPDGDVIHQAAAMNLRHRMGLAHNQRRTLEQHFLMVGLERLEIDRPRVTRAAEVAQQAESRGRIDLERAMAARLGHPIAPVAEKNEAAADQPSQQVAHFHQLALCRRLLADLQRPGGHRFEIAGRRAHLLEHVPKSRGDALGVVRAAVQAQFEMHERLGMLDRPHALERD